MGKVLIGNKIMDEGNKEKLIDNISSLKVNLDELYSNLTNIISDKINEGDLDVARYIDMAKNIKIVNEQLEDAVHFVQAENFLAADGNENIKGDIEKEDKDANSLKSFGHSITESFLKTKPLGYKLLSDELIKTKNWKDLYIKTCKQLLTIDEKIFKNFLDNPKMNWTSVKYFTKKKPKTANFTEVADGIYVNTLFGANEYMSMIRKMLEEYNIDIYKYNVFLKE